MIVKYYSTSSVFQRMSHRTASSVRTKKWVSAVDCNSNRFKLYIPDGGDSSCKLLGCGRFGRVYKLENVKAVKRMKSGTDNELEHQEPRGKYAMCLYFVRRAF